jgi:hypothetical protein
MTPRRFLPLVLLVLAACTGRRDPPGGPPLPAAVALMTEAAGVGTDEAFDAYKRDERITPGFVAPAGFRALLASGEATTWAGVDAGARWDDDRLALFWTGHLRVAGDLEKAEARLAARLAKAGLKPADGELTTYLAGTVAKRERERAKMDAELKLPPSKKRIGWAFARTTGKVREELVILDPARTTGVGEWIVARFEWCVAADLPGGPPTLQALLDAAPALRPAHREPGLVESLKDAPAYGYESGGSGWHVRTDPKFRDGYEAALRAAGFDPGKEVELSSGLGTHVSWYREADWTSASVTVLAEPAGQVMLGCQRPQK